MLDEIASRVSGPVTAKDCRVVWADGWLYVVRTTKDIVAIACEQPKRTGGTYKVVIEGQILSFLRPGCGGCRARVRASAIGQMSVEQIVELGRVLADA